MWRVERRYETLTTQKHVAAMLLDALRWRITRVSGAVDRASGRAAGAAAALLQWTAVPVSLVELLPHGAAFDSVLVTCSAEAERGVNKEKNGVRRHAPLTRSSVARNEARLDALAAIVRALNAAARGTAAALSATSSSPDARQLVGIMLLAEGEWSSPVFLFLQFPLKSSRSPPLPPFFSLAGCAALVRALSLVFFLVFIASAHHPPPPPIPPSFLRLSLLRHLLRRRLRRG